MFFRSRFDHKRKYTHYIHPKRIQLKVWSLRKILPFDKMNETKISFLWFKITWLIWELKTRSNSNILTLSSNLFSTRTRSFCPFTQLSFSSFKSGLILQKTLMFPLSSCTKLNNLWKFIEISANFFQRTVFFCKDKGYKQILCRTTFTR